MHAVYTILSTIYISTIQYFLVILHFLIERCSLQDFEPGISTPIEQVYKSAIYPSNELSSYSVHVPTFFSPIQHVYVPSTRVEFHCVPLSVYSVKLPTCAPTGRCATYSATLSCKNLPLRLLACNILLFRLSCICYTIFRLSRYYCVVSLGF